LHINFNNCAQNTFRVSVIAFKYELQATVSPSNQRCKEKTHLESLSALNNNNTLMWITSTKGLHKHKTQENKEKNQKQVERTFHRTAKPP